MSKRYPLNPLADDIEEVARLLVSIAAKIREKPSSEAPVGAAYADYVPIAKAAELTGYSRAAIQAKINTGVWLDGRETIKAPDGRRLISMKAYAAWVERGG